jgi:hypothetical protein
MRRFSWKRLTVLLVPTLAALGWVVLRAPLQRRAAGDTRCYPFIGPRMQVDSTLPPRDRAIATAHESAHVAQCKRDGFVLNYVKRLATSGRLAAEIDAFCAEGQAEAALGTRADHVVARVLDELEEGYPWFRGTTRRGFLDALDKRCGDLVTAARQRARRPLA